jgi:hypothetical protein
VKFDRTYWNIVEFVELFMGSMALLDVLLGMSFGTLASFALSSLVAHWIFWIVYCRTLHPLAEVPGPFLASFSRAWLMYRIYVGDLETAQRACHDQYGPLVRMAPNEVSSSDPAAIPKIYRLQNPLPKTDFYTTFRPVGISKQADLFTETDEVAHANYRKIVNNVYMLTSVLRSEDAIDECTRLFITRLGEFADRKEEMDFGEWLEM